MNGDLPDTGLVPVRSATLAARAPGLPRLATASAAAAPLAALGALLATAAWRLDRAAFLRHFVVPVSFAEPPLHAGAARALLAAFAAALLALAAATFAWAARQPPRKVGGAVLRILLALAVSVGAAEALLRRMHRVPYVARLMGGLTVPHPRYGWAPRPSSAVARPLRVRPDVAYVFDADGNRVASAAAPPDRLAPTILLAGESMALSYSLPWEQGIAALLSRQLGVQVVNAAVPGHAADQTALRAEDALPRYPRLLAVVTFFPALVLARNLNDFRPRLVLRDDGSLALAQPASGWLTRWALRDEFVNAASWMAEGPLRESLRLSAAVELDLARKVQARGAVPLFVMPTFGPRRRPEEHPEAFVAREVFEAQGLRVLIADWDARIPFDGHPDAEGARQLASAIAAALRPLLPPATGPAAGAGGRPSPTR